MIKYMINLAVLLIAGVMLSGCSKATNDPIPYLYDQKSGVLDGHGVVLSRVYADRPEEASTGLFDSLAKAVDGVNTKVMQAFHGKDKLLVAAQVVLVGPDSQQYYLGDYYSPDHSHSRVSINGIFFDFNKEPRQARTAKVGNKGDFKVYNNMPAYSLLSLPQGEYQIVASAYYKKDGSADKEFRYEPINYKKFHIAAGEVAYIGDIAALTSSAKMVDKFAQAQEYMDIAYPEIGHKLLFKPFG